MAKDIHLIHMDAYIFELSDVFFSLMALKRSSPKICDMPLKGSIIKVVHYY